VRVLAPTVDAVGAEYAGSFHAIVIFDVMEHLTDPVGILRALARLLAPGGVMLIETGNTDATPWRVCGTDFWYCGLVEHVGFFNRRSIAKAGERAAGMALVHFERTKHGYGVALRMRAMAPLRTAGYYGIRALHAAGVPLGERMGTVASGTAPRTWGMRDHFLALLRKPRDADQRPAATGETST
jgi:SAM-dependent methyltransferase